jgi:hypothetical protein
MMNGWIYRFEWLSLYNPSAPRFFSTLNSFMHSERQFKQQKIEILSKFTSPDSSQFRKMGKTGTMRIKSRSRRTKKLISETLKEADEHGKKAIAL